MKNESVYIYGKHVLEEALASKPEAIEKVFLTSRDEQSLIDRLKKNQTPFSIIDSRTLPKGIDPEVNHQGVIGLLKTDKLIVDFDDFLAGLEISNNTALVLLNEIQDPQNVGAIIRSAAAFGISGVLLPEHNQAPVSSAAIKVSAGMAFRLPLVSIGNTNQTIEKLKKVGFWIYGLDGEAKQKLVEEKFDAPTVFVLGNENRGIREKTLEHCDILLKIPMVKNCESLNVAASATVAFYDWSLKRPNAIR